MNSRSGGAMLRLTEGFSNIIVPQAKEGFSEPVGELIRAASANYLIIGK